MGEAACGGMLGGDGIHVSPSARDRSRWRRPFSCWASVVALERCARVAIRLCIGGCCSVGESVAVIAGDDWCWWTAVWPWGADGSQTGCVVPRRFLPRADGRVGGGDSVAGNA